jgi:sulfatase-like protein
MSLDGIGRAIARPSLLFDRAVLAATRLRRGIVWAATAAAGCFVGTYFWWAETHETLLFGCAVTFAIAALVVVVAGRLLGAAIIVSAGVILIRQVSYAKQEATDLILHAYDLVWLASAWSRMGQLWSDHHGQVVTLFAALVATATIAWVAHRVDTVRVNRAHALLAAVAFAALAAAGAVMKGERRHTELYFESLYVSFFYASWAETLEALWRGRLIEAANADDAARLAANADCAPATRPPHIILIHQESVAPPALFPALAYDRGLDTFFRSADGKYRKLRVETYGGASWLTEFSVITGLSTQSFGGMRQFVQPVLGGKVRETLPQALARCGYRSVMFYPMLKSFLGSGRFFERAGIADIRDAKDQGAKLPNERDRFYYDNALAEARRHLATSKQPLFLYIQTMAAHGPYDYAYMPQVEVAGGGAGTHPEMHEFLRRLAMGRMDYAYLRAELARRFPRQPFLIVHYGDHQPTATRFLLGFGEDAAVEDVLRSGNPAALESYYALDTIGYRLPPLAALERVDVPYLGTVLLEAAGLPLSDAYRERRRLMLLCQGRYHDCPEREEVLKFHRRLLDSALIDPL